MDIEIKQKVRGFLKSIDIYALGDLEKMLECANDQSEHQRLAIPIALTSFSVLDIIGFLIRQDINEESLRETKENLHSSLAYFYGREINQIQRDMVIELYRNGMMHSFLPKGGLGIHNTINCTAIITSNGQSFDFNVHTFAKLLIKRFRKGIKSDFEPHWETILNNYLHFHKDAEAAFKKYHNQIPKSPSKIMSISPTTRQFP